MFTRPNLNQVISAIEKILPDKMERGVVVYLSCWNDGRWLVGLEAHSELWVSTIIGSRDRKFLRKLVTGLIDKIEQTNNDRRRQASKAGKANSTPNREDY